MGVIWGASIPKTHGALQAGAESAEELGFEEHSLHGKRFDFLFYGVTFRGTGFGIVRMIQKEREDGW